MLESIHHLAVIAIIRDHFVRKHST